MRTLPLPKFFLATVIACYMVEVSIGNSLTLLLQPHAGWTRSDLAFSAILAVAITVPAIFKERSRRRNVGIAQR